MTACVAMVVLESMRLSEREMVVCGERVQVEWTCVGWEKGEGFSGEESSEGSLARRSDMDSRSGVVSIRRISGAVGAAGRM